MIQQIVIALIFASALAYLGRMMYRSFQAKHACSSGCGKCGAVNFEKIEKQINASISAQQKSNSPLKASHMA